MLNGNTKFVPLILGSGTEDSFDNATLCEAIFLSPVDTSGMAMTHTIDVPSLYPYFMIAVSFDLAKGSKVVPFTELKISKPKHFRGVEVRSFQIQKHSAAIHYESNFSRP